MRDLISNIGAELALVPAVKTAAGEGPAIDLLGFGRIAFLVTTGAIAGDGDFGVKVQESDSPSPETFTDADAAVVDSTAPVSLGANATYKLGYRGFRRYVRLALTKAGGTSIAAGAVAVLGDVQRRPAA
ncbi:hypothetical protein EDC22_102347 [Tepidamorphus gemmatus]|uniref:Uncharacterized protein n=1 Tax=Tepidamorphus gemmatus TaxID=747076 RepID=A0A4R3MJD0_9HYPH|nr:hypothetical protein [Tepidamorphus gemmatus]TCT12662.1 hypothetical protein EDC22_102347 [Tepidamorphus gemmatus]